MTGVCFAISDADRRIVMASEGNLALLGCTREGAIGHDWREWITDEQEFQTLSPSFKRLVADKTPFDAVARIIRADGSTSLVAGRCGVIRGMTPADDLYFAQSQPLDGGIPLDHPDAFACADFVRDLTYDLAALTGRYKMRNLTQALIASSATAEATIDLLTKAAAEHKR